MTTREKKLAALVGLAVALWGGNRGLASYREAVERAEAEQSAAEVALSEANAALLRGQRARTRLNRWRRQSLPTNADIAESLYQDWLRATLLKAGLTVRELRDTSYLASGTQRKSIAAAVQCQGSLEQVAGFLAQFYAAPHLHRISKASLTPTEDRQQLKFAFDAEGLVLAECPRTDSLAQPDQGTDPTDWADTVAQITGRNLFVPYQGQTAGSQAAAGADGRKDASLATSEVAAKMTFSGVTYGERGWRAAIRDDASQRVRYCREGGSLEVGSLEVKVVQIEDRRLLIEVDGQRFELRGGQNLSQASPLDAPAA